ncbi:2Fe-2S iron-sulfur cluster-binding protein [Caballeronia cordobensis]|uniref:2Fe-2S iron-sulfur cluster-binding protein n=1 Tax=Caballeronia cordobensis TaxID=1353886 RepID=UPI00045EFA92|nr:ferredoxin [Burkholderia sp. RPE67]
MHKVHVSTTGESFTLPHDAYLSDAAELQLAGLTFGCRAGMCGICVIEVIDGAANLSLPDEDETRLLAFLGYRDASHRLACQCQLHGDVTIQQR